MPARTTTPALPLPRDAPAPAARPAPIVGLGASAGGLEALGAVLSGLPRGFAAPVLAVLHLDPGRPSHAVPLLQARTRLPVKVATQGARPRAGTVYLAPPDRHLVLRAGRLHLSRAAPVSHARPSVDLLFASLARERGSGTVVAVLSGAGRDGADGVAAVKADGGVAVAQDPAGAAFAGMPAAAVGTGRLDAVLPLRQLPAYLVDAVARQPALTPAQWRRILDVLERRTGSTFGKYRASTLHRRLHVRMAARRCRTVAAYLRVLEADPDEAGRLQEAFLIKVSSFRRDGETWRVLDARLAAAARRATAMRAWSAGCATGEEAYSLALALARALGVGRGAAWKVYGTDVDEAALRTARWGRYSEDRVKGLARKDLQRHFVRDGTHWRVGKDLRDHVAFGRHDLLRDAPLPMMDVVACRNVLIYFAPREKQAALTRLASAVRPGGLLFLGRSETADLPGFTRLGRTSLFRKAPLRGQVPSPPRDRDAGDGAMRRRAGADRHARPSAGLRTQQDLNEELQSRNEELETVNEELQSLNDEMTTMEAQMRSLAEEAGRANDFLRVLLDTSSDVLVACDSGHRVTFWNKAAVRAFRLSAAQAIGGKLFSLVPALATPAVRAAARKARAPGRGGRVSLEHDGDDLHLDPLPAPSGRPHGYLLRIARRR